MKKFDCAICGGNANYNEEWPFFLSCDSCWRESNVYARPIEALKNWNYNNRFTAEEKTKVLELIRERSDRDQATYYSNLEEHTKIPKVKLKKIIKELKDEEVIFTCAMVSSDWPWYYGIWFAYSYKPVY